MSEEEVVYGVDTSLGWFNRLKYWLHGSPKYCKDCGNKLELKLEEEYGVYDAQTGEVSVKCYSLCCFWAGERHTHMYFFEKVS